MRKKIGLMLLAFIVACAFMPVTASAAVPSGTTYDDVIKVSKKTAYCACPAGIYKVNLKTGKKKRLVKGSSFNDPGQMTKKGKYIYYIAGGTSDQYSWLRRIRTSGGKPQTLAGGFVPYAVHEYVISGNRIFYGCYVEYDDDSGDTYWDGKVMNLNGSGKRALFLNFKYHRKRSNAKGYKVVFKEKGSGAKFYLKKPGGKKIYLGKLKNWI